MDTNKIRKRWKPEEKHMDATIDYAISDVYNLCSRIEQLQAERGSLKEFARHVIRTECWAIYEQDGLEIQDLAEKLELIKPSIVTAEDDYEDFDTGDTIFKFTDILKEE